MIKKNYLALFAKSFNWAGFFLPKNIYDDCSKLYAFCRILDDLVDEKDNLELKIERFNEIKNIFKNSYELDHNDSQLPYKNEHELIINDMIILADNNNIKRIILDDLIEGVGSDLKKRVYLKSVKDVLVYSYKVAGTVGLMMAKILNVNDTRSLKGAIDLGIAMQLTNIARDVCEDKKRNREYIKSDFSSIREIIIQSHIFYEKSFTSISSIPLRSSFSVIVARRIYKKIGDYILKQKNTVNYNKAGKIYVPIFQKIVQTFLSIFDLLKLLFVKELYYDNHNNHNILNEEIKIDERI